jgi:hypothetical protein
MTNEDIDIAFEKILKSVSDIDMALPASFIGDDDKLLVDEQKKMLAVFARYISEGHPGFASCDAKNITFSEDVKNKFKLEFLKLYLTSEKECSVLDMGKKLFKFTKKYLPDNHFNVFSNQGTPIGMLMNKEEHLLFQKELADYLQNETIDASQRGIIEHLYAERNQVGKNLCDDSEIEGLKCNGVDILDDKKGQTWRMTKIKNKGQNIMMIGMKRFAAIDENGKLSEDLIRDYIALVKEFSKQEYDECDVLILDLRGNGGGWPYIGDYMDRTLYGNTVSTEPKGHLKLDTTAAKLSYAYMEQDDYDNYESKKDRLRLIKENQNTQYSERDGAWTDKYPFNSELGYKKPILVLTDQNTGSNAEVTIGRLREHPYMRTIGDHSCGVVQYHPAATPKASIPLPFGLKIAVPPQGFTGPNGERLEGIGYQPDYPVCKGGNALLVGLERIDEIKQDILQNLPPENNIKTECKREVNIDEVTEMNLKYIGKNNSSLRNCFNELVDITSTIPQLKTPEHQIDKSKLMIEEKILDEIKYKIIDK